MVDKATENSRIKDLQKLGYRASKRIIPHPYENIQYEAGELYVKYIDGELRPLTVLTYDLKNCEDYNWDAYLEIATSRVEETERRLKNNRIYQLGKNRVKKVILDELNKLRSRLSEEQKSKLSKVLDKDKIDSLRLQIDLLIKLQAKIID